MSDDSYTIKEFIADKFDNPETGVFVRLDRIDTKQATANGRTSKIEGKQKAYIMVISVVWAITVLLGGYFFTLSVKDIAVDVVKDAKVDIIKDATSGVKDLVEQKVGEALQQYK